MSHWEPPSGLEETLKAALLPPRLLCMIRAHRELRRGERELRLLPWVMDKSRNSVDVGANKGVYTYWMQKHSRHVYAYEPNPKMFKILAAGARGNVTASPVALSNKNGRAMLRIPKSSKGYSNQGASLNYEKVGRKFGQVEVETRRLDDEDVHDIGFIKIDVEGFEFPVLEGAAQTIKGDRPTLLIEIEEVHNQIPIGDALKRVTDFGYTGFALINGTLSPLDFFDAEANHRNPRTRRDYIFNFLFFPQRS